MVLGVTSNGSWLEWDWVANIRLGIRIFLPITKIVENLKNANIFNQIPSQSFFHKTKFFSLHSRAILAAQCPEKVTRREICTNLGEFICVSMSCATSTPVQLTTELPDNPQQKHFCTKISIHKSCNFTDCYNSVTSLLLVCVYWLFFQTSNFWHRHLVQC